MATKSIYNNVNVKDKNLCKSLILALENAQGKVSKPIVMTKKVRSIEKEKIKGLFSE